MGNNKRFLNFGIALFFILQNLYLNAAVGESDPIADAMKFTGFATLLIIILVLWLIIVLPEKNTDINKLFKNFRDVIISKITLAKPVENEHEILMDHDYDGIRELDNKVPPIFNLLFYGTILFAIIYLIQFHIVGSGNIMESEFKEEVKLAEMERNLLIRSGAFLTEETVTQLTENSALLAGQDIFMKNCTSCHGVKAGGLVGPNLTDKFWINGGGIKNIFKVIRDGVPQKGMISWQTQLAPKQIQEVASYIMSLEGTNPPNAKEPQGKEYKTPENDKI